MRNWIDSKTYDMMIKASLGVKDGESEPSRYTSIRMKDIIPTQMILQPGNPIFMHTSSGTG